MSERLRKILFKEKSKDQTPIDLGVQAPKPQLIIHKTTSAQRCDVCHQSDMFDPQTAKCKRCENIPISASQQLSSNPVNSVIDEQTDQVLQTHNNFALIGFIVVIALSSLLYKILVWGHLDQVDILTIGLPTILAILTTFVPKQRTFTGTIMKGLTLVLLMVSIFAGAFFGESVLCIFTAMPLFYIVGSFVGALLDIITRNDRPRRHNGPLSIFVPLPFLIMNLEGVMENIPFSNNKEISIETPFKPSIKTIEKYKLY